MVGRWQHLLRKLESCENQGAMSFRTLRGAQIDLVIDRAGHTINLCEMKFTDAEFSIDKRYANQLRNKRSAFGRATHSRKMLFITMVTTYGTKDNIHAQALGVSSVTMDALFD